MSRARHAARVEVIDQLPRDQRRALVHYLAGGGD
jgi:hypothetical protein